MLTHESRHIIDSEEADTDVLIRVYLLTRDRRHADETVKRVKEVATWGGNKNVVGGFNEATLLLLCLMAYDALYDALDNATRKSLLNETKEFDSSMYKHNISCLENHVANNHIWWMIFCILIIAAFTVYGELSEADAWTDYRYSLWLACLPDLNKDDGWHSDDSCFHANLYTFVEAPYSYMRLTGYDYFSDPWYQGNVLYVIYQQPPLSKLGSNDSPHQDIFTPSGTCVGYIDALIHMVGDVYIVDYVRHISGHQLGILEQGSTSKAGGLAWFCL